jgi:hypothetical protein
MEKEFIPWEQALALKELEFDKPCFGYYDEQGKHYPMGTVIGPDIINFGMFIPSIQKGSSKLLSGSPLYQQAFRWFREKYNLEVILCPDCLNSSEKLLREYKIISVDKSIVLEPIVDQKYWTRKGCFKTYEESELECLKKLIEIVKNGQ